MSTLDIVEAYLAARRALGVRLEREGRYLHQFVRETGNIPLSNITSASVTNFLRGRSTPTATWRTKRSSLAGLYRYAIARGLVAVSPLPEYPPKLSPPQTPYVYSTIELQRLLEATALLSHPASRLQATTYRTLLLLLYSSGLRVGEAVALKVSDVDLAQRLITVRDTKFYKYAGVRAMPTRAAVNCAATVNPCTERGEALIYCRHSYRPSRNVRSLPCGRYRPALLL